MSKLSEGDRIEEDIRLALSEQDHTLLAKKVTKIFANHEGHWSGRGQHVEFGRLETIPLKEGRYLGQGSFGDVYETFCKNLPVARKRVHFKNQVKIKDVKKEVEILQKLSHHHIINLLGSFTQNRMLGLLLLPVADCELGEFLEAIDQTPSDEHPNEICVILGLDAAAKHTGQPLDPVLRLRPLMGCIANAIEYLHKNRIRHKDIKPSNILLKKDLVVITDFGLSKDVSEESVTTSSGIEIGAFKYRAPEVTLNLPRGRAADIFSLGCVFSQIFAVVKGESLAKFEDVLEEDSYGLRSFQRDIDKVLQWQERLRTSTSASTWSESQIFNLIGNMMKRDPHERPNASQVCLSLYSIGSGIEGEPSPYHGSCCPLYLDIIDRQQSQIGEYESKIGEYESKVLEMKVKMEELVRNGDELRAKHVEYSSAKDALVAQLQDTNNRQQATIYQGEQDMSELRLHIDALERGNADLQVAAAELRVEIHRLQLRRREMQDAFESKEQEIHNRYRDRAARDAAGWREERALLIKESKTHRREIDRRKSDYSKKTDQLSEENLMLRREIDRQRSGYSGEIDRMKEENAIHQREITSLLRIIR